MEVDIDLLGRLVEEGYLLTRPHPEADLVIYNYSVKTQFERYWTPETMMCRGLITTSSGTVIARPFPKFFNLGEHQEQLPLEPFTVTMKIDGCFVRHTTLNLWDGGTVTIGEIVKNRLSVSLVGMNEKGELVPTQVIDWHQNGTKDYWLDIEVDCPVSRLSGAGGHSNSLRVTVNHQIWTNGEYRPVCEIKPGDQVITQELEPSPEALRLIRASLLGDGCILPSFTRSEVAKYQESHSEKQSEYVYWLREKLGSCGSHRNDTTSGYGSQLIWVGSREYRMLGDMYREWYSDGIKHVPQDLSWLDDFAIAKWFMDDGSLSHSEKQQDRALFATNGFTLDDVERLARHIEALYGVRCTVFNSKGWTLRINAGKNGEIDRFWEAITPFIIPSLRYKVPDCYRSLPFNDIEQGKENVVPRKVSVLSVTDIAPTKRNFPAGRQGYDITTTTGNYFARGVLVHNSLGILYWRDNEPYIATRGSFTSEQAVRANRLLQRYQNFPFQKEYTYLFEILYPENRVVVDYGDTEDLILLAIIHTETGREIDIHATSWPFPVVRRYDGITDIAQLQQITEENAEGFVIRFESGLRLKLKFAEYVRLHRLMTQVNAKTIWEHLRSNQPFDELLLRVPDEFYAWVRNTREDLLTQFRAMEEEGRKVYEQVKSLPTRKEQAAIVRQTANSALVFRMLDGKDYAEVIWKQLRPQAERPFRVDIDA